LHGQPIEVWSQGVGRKGEIPTPKLEQFYRCGWKCRVEYGPTFFSIVGGNEK
jgi:hypothetical protein